MNRTAGIFIMNENKEILICGNKWGHWSIPKGMVDYSEKPREAALRELKEETNLDIVTEGGLMLNHLTPVKYKKSSKTLIPFMVKLSDKIKVEGELKCNSMVQHINGKPCTPFPEQDKFAWVTFDEAVERLHESQSRALMANWIYFDQPMTEERRIEHEKKMNEFNEYHRNK